MSNIMDNIENKYYSITKILDASDFKNGDLILYGEKVYKIRMTKYQTCAKNMYTAVTYRCADFFDETKGDFLRFTLKKPFFNSRIFENEVHKITFKVNNGNIVDVNNKENIIEILDDDCNIVEIKYKNTTDFINKDKNKDEEQLINYVKYKDNYKIV